MKHTSQHYLKWCSYWVPSRRWVQFKLSELIVCSHLHSVLLCTHLHQAFTDSKFYHGSFCTTYSFHPKLRISQRKFARNTITGTNYSFSQKNVTFLRLWLLKTIVKSKQNTNRVHFHFTKMINSANYIWIFISKNEQMRLPLDIKNSKSL